MLNIVAHKLDLTFRVRNLHHYFQQRVLLFHNDAMEWPVRKWDRSYESASIDGCIFYDIHGDTLEATIHFLYYPSK